jgi:hypothetical protein
VDFKERNRGVVDWKAMIKELNYTENYVAKCIELKNLFLAYITPKICSETTKIMSAWWNFQL